MIDQVYVAVNTETGASIGIAKQGVKGYFPLDNMPEFKTYNEAMDHADALNSSGGISSLDAWKIVASTMR